MRYSTHRLPASCSAFRRRAWRFSLGLAALLALICAVMPPMAATAQKDDAEEGLTPEDKLPPPKDIILETRAGEGRDGSIIPPVRIISTYYPGDGVRGQDTVPVMMLHGEKGNRQDFHSLAIFLQRRHHAVIAPDLRGHGDSTRTTFPNIKLDAEKMPHEQYMLMMAKGGDLERVKKFLVEEHNAKRLNIDKLCLVGAEMGAIVAMDWAMLDWSWPALSTGKQGQDVKAIVLLSPEERFKTLKITDSLKSEAIARHISFYIAVGASEPGPLKESERVFKALCRVRPKDEYDADQPKDNTLFFNEQLMTDLQGARLLGKNLHIEQQIAEFIDVRIEQEHIAWKERKKPL